MEIVVQLVAELLGSFVSVAVGVALGTVALVAMVGVRRAHARVSRSFDVEAPDGQLWSVRVVYGLGRKLSSRLAGMSSDARRKRRAAGRSDTEVGRDEIWHPRRLLDAFDDAAGLVAPLVVIAAFAIGVLFVIEVLIAIPIGILFLLVSAIRGRWQVDVVDHTGRRSTIDCSSLAEARDEARRTADLIMGGIRPECVPAAPFLPDRVASLADHADQEGIRIVSVVRERWKDESERYRARGERVLAAVADDEVVGIGALSQCPQVSAALRMRRFYVAPAWRRHGVGRASASSRWTRKASPTHIDVDGRAPADAPIASGRRSAPGVLRGAR